MDRERASPYQPSDRRFLEPLLIDVSRLPEAAPHAALFRALRAGETVDYPGVWAARQQVLQAAWARFDRMDMAFLRFRAGRRGLAGFATFNAIAAQQGPAIRAAGRPGCAMGRMPASRPTRPPMPRRSASTPGCNSWPIARWPGAARAGAGLYRDLAVGTAGDGSELWAGEMGFLKGLSIGAPPDPLGPLGQVWGVPPPDPLAGEASGHAGFASLIRANMRHAAALRIDHVLGLKRLFLVPDGARGCGLLSRPALRGRPRRDRPRKPTRPLRGGRRDLGTVPDGLREALHEARILSYRVLWFEREGQAFRKPEHYPRLAAACVATHDIPTLAGWWTGADITEREALGLLDASGAADARAERTAERATLMTTLGLEALGLEALKLETLGQAGLPDDIAAAIHAYVARHPLSCCCCRPRIWRASGSA